MMIVGVTITNKEIPPKSDMCSNIGVVAVVFGMQDVNDNNNDDDNDNNDDNVPKILHYTQHFQIGTILPMKRVGKSCLDYLVQVSCHAIFIGSTVQNSL